MNSWRTVFLLVGAGVVASFQIGKVAPVLPGLRSELGLSLFQAGWVFSMFNVTGLILGPLGGALADRLGLRRLLLSGLVIQGIASLAGSLVGNGGLLLASRFLEGLGFLTIASAAPALIARAAPAEKTRLALGVWSTFVPAGMTAILLAAPLLVRLLGWRGLWQVNALILLGYALILFMLTQALPNSRWASGVVWRSIFPDVWKTVSAPGPLLLALVFSTYTLQWVTVMGFFPTLLMESRRMAMASSSLLTAVMVAVNVPGNLMGGWLLQRGIRRQSIIMGASMIMGGAGLVIFNSGFPFVVQYLACLVFSGFGGLLPAAVIGGAPMLTPHPKLLAATNGLILQGSNLGQVLGPPLLAWTVTATGSWQSAPWVLTSAASVGILLSLFLGRKEGKLHNL